MIAVILQVGDTATPITNKEHTDPVSRASMVLPTNGVPGTVLQSSEIGTYSNGDLKYQYILEFDPQIETYADVVSVDESGIETTTLSPT